jgi:hypothetical protein
VFSGLVVCDLLQHFYLSSKARSKKHPPLHAGLRTQAQLAAFTVLHLLVVLMRLMISVLTAGAWLFPQDLPHQQQQQQRHPKARVWRVSTSSPVRHLQGCCGR